MTDWRLPQHGLFVTGTDTEVGKTWVSTHILRVLRGFSGILPPFPTDFQGEKNQPAKNQGPPLLCARKPVASGAERTGDHLLSADTRLLAAVSGEPAETVTRYQLARPISPARAAREAGLDTSLSRLMDACKAPLGRWTLVEGAGGFLSPLGSDNSLNADLAETLGLPVLLVVGLKLGCINHTLLTLEAIAHRNLSCAGVVVNDLNGCGDPATVKELASLTDRPIYAMPHGQPANDWPAWLCSLELVAQPEAR